MASDGSFVTNDSGSIVVPDLKSDDSLLLAVERLLNRSNLQTDAYLVSKMKDDMLIPLDVLAQAPGLLSFRESPSSAQELVERLRPLIAKSSQVSLSADQNSVRPNFSIQRHTIIIRDIPSSTPTDEVRNLLPEAHRNKIGNIHSEVGNNWFVSFESEPDAVEALAIIRRSKFNGQTVHARLKAESLLRGTPSVRSAPRPAPGAAPTPSSTAESSTLPTNSNFHAAVPTHSSFYAGGLPPVAKSAAGPSFPQYYPSTPYYQPSSWYYSGASLPIHDSLIPPAATQQFTSPPTPTTGAAAPAPPAHFTSPAFSQTNQSIPAAQPGFESSPQPPHPTTSPRSRPSSTGTQYSSRKPGSSTASGSGPSQPRTKLSSGSSSTAPPTGNVPPAKRRPRNPSPITNSKSGEGGHHTNSSHTSATTKKRNPRGASTSRSEETSNRHSESHSQKPVSLGIRNFPPLGSSTPSTTPPTSSVASSWTKEGVTVVKSIPSSKPSHHQAPPKPAPVQPTPETQSQPTTASPVVTPHTPVTSTTPATAPVTHPSSQPTPPPVTSPVIASPLPFTPTVVTPPLSTPPPVIPSPAQTVQQPNSKPLWASIAAKPPASGQH